MRSYVTLALGVAFLAIGSRAAAQTSVAVPLPSTVPASVPASLAPTLPLPNPTPPVPAAADLPPSIQVTVESSRPDTVIERRVNTMSQWQSALGLPVYTWGETWEQACVTPCTVRINPHASYRVGGAAGPSSRFVLPQGQSDLRLHVQAGSGFWYTAGATLASVGATSTLAGGIIVFVAPNITNAVSEDTLRVIGFTLLGAGIAMLAVGIPLWLANASSVTTSDGKKLARSHGVHLSSSGVTF